MHEVKFFPLGNADSCLITTTAGRKFLFDFGNERDPQNKDDKRIDLAKALREDLDASKRDGFDVLAITHLDNDHVCGAPDFFYFEHAAKYQSKDRAKIGELWVPAAVIVEDRPDGDAGVVQAEARHRFKNKKGIRVFSRPERLKEWMEKHNLNIDEYADFITDAGRTVPKITIPQDGVEFFIHSPFAEHCDGEIIERNDASLVMQARFLEGSTTTELILSADTTHDIWTSIVNITAYHDREDRLRWNLFKLPHHCSYKSLGEDKGKEKTEPNNEVKWLIETQGQDGCIVVSTSDPIPSIDTTQPPHRQAANYYKGVMAEKDGDFLVTMQEPNKEAPAPLIFDIGKDGVKRRTTTAATGSKLAAAISDARGTPAPPAQRVGFGSL
jgi:hypothetical protein